MSGKDEKLEGMGRQMVQLDQDFEAMLEAREEAKRRLEEKFKAVYKRIKDNRDFTIREGQKVNMRLKEGQIWFNEQLEVSNTQLQSQLDTEKQSIEETLAEQSKRMAEIEQGIEAEREERRADLNKELGPMSADIAQLHTDIQGLTSTRVSKEAGILQAMEEGNELIGEMLEKERDEREKQKAEMFEYLKDAISKLDGRKTEFNDRTLRQFQEVEDGMLKEMGRRFDHQNEIIDDIREVIATFQKTLKVVGNKD